MEKCPLCGETLIHESGMHTHIKKIHPQRTTLGFKEPFGLIASLILSVIPGVGDFDHLFWKFGT